MFGFVTANLKELTREQQARYVRCCVLRHLPADPAAFLSGRTPWSEL